MGRIKTKQIKRVTQDLVDNHGDQFTHEYAEKKVKVEQYAEIKSKKLRNTIAGYVTRLTRMNKD